MGVPAGYYDPFVKQLTALGHSVVRVHWREENREFPPSHKDYGYAEVAEVDVPAAARYAREQFGTDPIVIGHSLGGQFATISAARGGPYQGIVLIASGTNHWRGYRGVRSLGVLFVYAIFAPLAVRLLGFWPGGRFGFGGRQCARLIRDWARLGRSGRFEPEGATLDHEAALRELALPVLAISTAGDHLVTPRATENLAGKLTGCAISQAHWAHPERKFRGHFAWAKSPNGPAGLIYKWTTDLPAAHKRLPPSRGLS